MKPVRSPSLPAAVLRIRESRVNEKNRPPCGVGHSHPRLHPAPSTKLWAASAQCIREVPTLRLPRYESGALRLSYGCGACWRPGSNRLRRDESPGLVPSGATSAWSAHLVSNETFRCIRAASSPADSGPSMHRCAQGFSDIRRRRSCRRPVIDICAVVVMGGFDPPPRAFQARALPTELHDRGAGPGTRTRINWGTNSALIPLGLAGRPFTSISRGVVRERVLIG
jgi:hypothetical protein